MTFKKKLKKVSVSGNKFLAPVPILKLDLGFGSRFSNLVSVVHLICHYSNLLITVSKLQVDMRIDGERITSDPSDNFLTIRNLNFADGGRTFFIN